MANYSTMFRLLNQLQPTTKQWLNLEEIKEQMHDSSIRQHVLEDTGAYLLRDEDPLKTLTSYPSQLEVYELPK